MIFKQVCNFLQTDKLKSVPFPVNRAQVELWACLFHFEVDSD